MLLFHLLPKLSIGADRFNLGSFRLLEKFKAKVRGQYQALYTPFKGPRAFAEQFHSDLSVRLVELAKGKDALDLEQEFRDCSEGLLSWPRTTKRLDGGTVSFVE